MPSATAAAHYQQITDRYQLGADIQQYLGIAGDDPHLFAGLLQLRNAVQSVGFDPDLTHTTTDAIQPQVLVALGTGDGRELQALIERFQPPYLLIAVQDWADFTSSFWAIDWAALSERYEADSRRTLTIGCYTKATEILPVLMADSLAGVDHGLIYCPPTASALSREIQSELTQKFVANAINYLGFTLDEVNMVWHAWRALQRQPRVFSQPSIAPGGRYVICGSGPSLDAALPLLPELARSHQIVACASNYRSLRAAGVEVDLLVLLERGDCMVDDYRATVAEFGAGATRLLASATCPAPLHELFADTATYFRPALTPLALFSDHPREILNFEGPQTINTGVAIAAALKAEQIVLVGVDLGVRDLAVPRSQAAAGLSPRQFNLERPANFGGTVFTDRLLLDGQLALEVCLRCHPGIKAFNASDGLAIAGAEPLPLADYLERCRGLPGDGGRAAFQSWWQGLPRYSPARFQASWRSRRPRQVISREFAALRELYSGSTPWFPDLLRQSTALLSLQVSPAQQFPRRMIRGVLHKLTLAITRQLQVMGREPEAQAAFLRQARQIVVQLLDQLEAECYNLCDQLEAQVDA